jgi:hypothetical protein
MFHRVIQSAIDKGHLRFSKAQQNNQLDPIGLDGKQIWNWLALVDSSEYRSLNVKERDMEALNEDKVIVHEYQIGDTLEDIKVIRNPKDTGGGEISLTEAEAD